MSSKVCDGSLVLFPTSSQFGGPTVLLSPRLTNQLKENHLSFMTSPTNFVFEFLFTSIEKKEFRLFSSWSGQTHLSSKEEDEELVLLRCSFSTSADLTSFFTSSHIPSIKSSNNSDKFSCQIFLWNYQHFPRAERVVLSCQTQGDWEIASQNPAKLERNLLFQWPFLSSQQIFTLSLDPMSPTSLKVKLRVSRISENEENSSSFGRLVDCSEIILEPPNLSESKNMKNVGNKNVKMDKDEQKQQKFESDNEEFLSNIEELLDEDSSSDFLSLLSISNTQIAQASLKFPLKVLPYVYFNKFPHSTISSSPHPTTTTTEYNDLNQLDCVLEEFENIDGQTSPQSILESEISLEDNKDFDESNHSIAFIHPMALKLILESILNKNLNENDFNKYFDKTLNNTNNFWIIKIKKFLLKKNDKNSSKILMLKFSTKIPVFSIFLPLLTRQFFSLQDNESINIELWPNGISVFPTDLTLNPYLWNNNSNEKENSDMLGDFYNELIQDLDKKSFSIISKVYNFSPNLVELFFNINKNNFIEKNFSSEQACKIKIEEETASIEISNNEFNDINNNFLIISSSKKRKILEEFVSLTGTFNLDSILYNSWVNLLDSSSTSSYLLSDKSVVRLKFCIPLVAVLRAAFDKEIEENQNSLASICNSSFFLQQFSSSSITIPYDFIVDFKSKVNSKEGFPPVYTLLSLKNIGHLTLEKLFSIQKFSFSNISMFPINKEVKHLFKGILSFELSNNKKKFSFSGSNSSFSSFFSSLPPNLTSSSLFSSNFIPLSGMDETFEQIVKNIDQFFSVNFFTNRIHYNLPWNPSTLLLLSQPGSGKTTLLKRICCHLSSNTNNKYPLPIHIELIDSKLLKKLIESENLSKSYEYLTNLFTRAYAFSPSLIIYDNIDDNLTSFSSYDALEDSNKKFIYDERALLLTFHLNYLIKIYQNSQQKLYNAHLSHYQKLLKNNSLISQQEKKNLLIKLSYNFYSKFSFLLFSSNISNISNIETENFLIQNFKKILYIKSLSFQDRFIILNNCLKRYDIQINYDNLLYKNKNHLIQLTEGFTASDLELFSRSVRNFIYSKLNNSKNKIKLNDFGMLEENGNKEFEIKFEEDKICIYSFDFIISLLKQFTPPSFASSSNNSSVSTSKFIQWEEIRGYSKQKEDMMRVLRYPILFSSIYKQVSLKLAKGILLYGPPGCGKTLLAHSMGNEFGSMGFLCIKGPEILDKYIGNSEKAIRNIFYKAYERNRPVVIFFDEFDSIGSKRGQDNTGVTDRVVNQLLTFLDGVDIPQSSTSSTTSSVFIIAATSRPDLIDPALIRPGRIEKHIYVGYPSVDDSIKIFENILDNYTIEEGKEEEKINSIENLILTLRNNEKINLFTPADWKAVINTAYLTRLEETLKNSGENNMTDNLVTLTPQILYEAFLDTPPSISLDDKLFYDAVHSKFQGKGKK